MLDTLIFPSLLLFFTRILVTGCVFAGLSASALASFEVVRVVPSAPTSAEVIYLVFEGVLEGPVVIDEVVTEIRSNVIRLVVSRRDLASGYSTHYEGRATVGLLPAGAYLVEFYTRSPGFMGTNAYSPPQPAASLALNVLPAPAGPLQAPVPIPMMSDISLIVLSLIVTLLGKRPNVFCRQASRSKGYFSSVSR